MSERKAVDIYSDFLKEKSAEKDLVTDQLRKEIHLKLVEASKLKEKNDRSKFIIKTVLAAAAVFLIVFSLSLSKPGSETDTMEKRIVHTSSVPEGKPVTVTLSYNALEKFEEVDFSIKLEEGLTFHTDNEIIKNLREHNWKGTLEKGENTIPFVVNSSGYGKRKIIVTAKYGNFIHFQEILLESVEGEIKVTHYSFKPVPVT